MSHPPFAPHAALRAGLILAAFAALTGCQARQVGGRLHEVRLVSVPDEAVAYVVPWDDWLEAGGDRRPALDAEFLRPHRVTSDLTPVVVKRPAYSYLFVAEKDGRYGISERFTPGPASVVTVRIMD